MIAGSVGIDLAELELSLLELLVEIADLELAGACFAEASWE